MKVETAGKYVVEDCDFSDDDKHPQQAMGRKSSINRTDVVEQVSAFALRIVSRTLVTFANNSESVVLYIQSFTHLPDAHEMIYDQNKNLDMFESLQSQLPFSSYFQISTYGVLGPCSYDHC